MSAAVSDPWRESIRGWRVRRWLAGAVLSALAACAAPPVLPVDAPAFASAGGPSSDASASAAPSAAVVAAEAPPPPGVRTDADDPELRAMLERVAEARGLPIKSRVRFAIVDRDALLARARHKLETEIPPGVLELQGESLKALGLLPLDFDLAEGLLRLLQGRVAGFYDPVDATMYLLDDLPVSQEEETLAHELVHALQDQSFAIGKLLAYRAGRSDESAAQQLLIEGDATSAMFDISVGSAFAIDETQLEMAFQVSTALSEVGRTTPSILRGSLVAPYTVGFRFVQELRRQGDFAAVNGAFRVLPVSTEQVLHPEKYAAREPVVQVPTPTLAPLGEGFEEALVDQNGELALRLMFEEWVPRRVAFDAAAGWGGDRGVVARRHGEGGSVELAFALHTRMDTEPDAVEAVKAIEAGLGKVCKERADLGPIRMRSSGRSIVIVAGPYKRSGASYVAAGDCALAERWARAILAQTSSR
jgi:hypothetical protein